MGPIHEKFKAIDTTSQQIGGVNVNGGEVNWVEGNGDADQAEFEKYKEEANPTDTEVFKKVPNVDDVDSKFPFPINTDTFRNLRGHEILTFQLEKALQDLSKGFNNLQIISDQYDQFSTDFENDIVSSSNKDNTFLVNCISTFTECQNELGDERKDGSGLKGIVTNVLKNFKLLEEKTQSLKSKFAKKHESDTIQQIVDNDVLIRDLLILKFVLIPEIEANNKDVSVMKKYVDNKLLAYMTVEFDNLKDECDRLIEAFYILLDNEYFFEKLAEPLSTLIPDNIANFANDKKEEKETTIRDSIDTEFKKIFNEENDLISQATKIQSIWKKIYKRGVLVKRIQEIVNPAGNADGQLGSTANDTASDIADGPTDGTDNTTTGNAGTGNSDGQSDDTTTTTTTTDNAGNGNAGTGNASSGIVDDPSDGIDRAVETGTYLTNLITNRFKDIINFIGVEIPQKPSIIELLRNKIDTIKTSVVGIQSDNVNYTIYGEDILALFDTDKYENMLNHINFARYIASDFDKLFVVIVNDTFDAFINGCKIFQGVKLSKKDTLFNIAITNASGKITSTFSVNKNLELKWTKGDPSYDQSKPVLLSDICDIEKPPTNFGDVDDEFQTEEWKFGDGPVPSDFDVPSDAGVPSGFDDEGPGVFGQQSLGGLQPVESSMSSFGKQELLPLAGGPSIRTKKELLDTFNTKNGDDPPILWREYEGGQGAKRVIWYSMIEYRSDGKPMIEKSDTDGKTILKTNEATGDRRKNIRKELWNSSMQVDKNMILTRPELITIAENYEEFFPTDGGGKTRSRKKKTKPKHKKSGIDYDEW